jgi:hypothetical protein
VIAALRSPVLVQRSSPRYFSLLRMVAITGHPADTADYASITLCRISGSARDLDPAVP